MSTAEQALQKLKQGNAAYLNSKKNDADISVSLRKHTSQNGQKPYAVIVSCSDSRVPPEHVFMAGIGELFVIRTAGHVISDFDLGSIEYGVKHLGAKIIVVLGHSGCGAVAAALVGQAEGYIQNILDEIKPVIRGVADAAEAEKLNVAHSYRQILKSAIVKELLDQNIISIKQAKYELETGEVIFF